MVRIALTTIVVILLLVFPVFANGPTPVVKAKETPKEEPKEMPKEKKCPSPADLPSNVIKVLRTTNKAQINRYVPKVYKFNNANPYEVVNFVEALVAQEEGSVYSFVNPDGNSGYILVVCPQYMLESLDKFVPQLDRPKITSAPGSKYIYYRLKHRNATDVAFRNALSYYMSGFQAVVPDLETNSLVLFDGPVGDDKAVKALETTLDVPTPQALMNVKIYEIALNNDGTIGLDYEAWKNGPGSFLFYGQTSGMILSVPHSYYEDDITRLIVDNIDVRDWYRSAGYQIDYASAFFDFLVEKGKAKVLTSTKVASINGYPVALATGDQILYYGVSGSYSTQTDVTGTDRYVQSATTPKSVSAFPLPLTKVYREPDKTDLDNISEILGRNSTSPTQLDIKGVDTGVFLEITPIIATDLLNLNVRAKVVSCLGFSDNGTPILSSDQFNNNIRVKDGDSVLLGGLTRERKIQKTRKIPFLGSLPVLGWIFGGEISTVQKTAIVAVITPKVVTDYSGMSDEERTVMDMAEGKIETPLPKTELGFDQYLLDKGY